MVLSSYIVIAVFITFRIIQWTLFCFVLFVLILPFVLSVGSFTSFLKYFLPMILIAEHFLGATSNEIFTRRVFLRQLCIPVSFPRTCKRNDLNKFASYVI